jgi:5-methylthioadenosine/S-adenosylhomocysteine deaminase
VGTIAPGCIADVVLLDCNRPFFVPLNDALRQWIYAGGDRAVQTVIVNGEIVLDNGMPTRVDAMEAASELKERLERNPSGSKEGGELRRQLVEQVERFFEIV